MSEDGGAAIVSSAGGVPASSRVRAHSGTDKGVLGVDVGNQGQQLGNSNSAVLIHSAEISNVAEIAVVGVVDGGENCEHPVAVLHQASVVFRTGGDAFFLRIACYLANGVRQSGKRRFKGAQAGVIFGESRGDIVPEERNSRVGGNVDVTLHPTDFRFHIGAAEVGAGGINGNLQP